MKIFQKFFKDIKIKTLQSLRLLRNVLSSESKQTKRMMEIYIAYCKKEATPEELKIAHSQFKDVLKTVGLGAFAIVPMSLFILPILIKLGEKYKINILPNSYQAELDKIKKKELE